MASANPLIVAILAALLGAVASGIVQTILRRSERSDEIKAIRAALAMEVAEICELMKFRGYVEATEELVADLKTDPKKYGTMVADLREDYFSVFHALSPQLGKLQPAEARKIVQFYMLCKAAKDSIAPDGIMAENEDHELSVENAQQLLSLMAKALQAGDEIAKWDIEQKLAVPTK